MLLLSYNTRSRQSSGPATRWFLCLWRVGLLTVVLIYKVIHVKLPRLHPTQYTTQCLKRVTWLLSSAYGSSAVTWWGQSASTLTIRMVTKVALAWRCSVHWKDGWFHGHHGQHVSVNIRDGLIGHKIKQKWPTLPGLLRMRHTIPRFVVISLLWSRPSILFTSIISIMLTCLEVLTQICSMSHKYIMITSSNGNIFRFIGPFWRESTGQRWTPLTKASDAELWCFLWSAPEQTVEQTI